MTNNLHATLRAVAVIVLCALAAGRWGSHLGSAASVVEREAVQDDVDYLVSTLAVIEQQHADPVDVEGAIYEGSIPSMLQRLDPHSMFFGPEAYRRLREEQRGSYAGVGMTIRPWGEETVIDHPFPDTPAFKAGVRPGDVVTRIDDQPAESLTVDEVAQHVRGPEGTSVRLTLRRPLVDELIEVTLVRESIPRPSVPLAFTFNDQIGYLRIATFNENTPDEFDEQLEKLESEGIKGLVLDLRDNQGGLLSAGIHVADRFLDRGQTIVSHWGRASDKRVYPSRSRRREHNYPMTVLVNCNSASASEIVAGALQDHDRGLIVGSNTFGKGLIQAVYNLSDTTGLVLTTARYYTPSGRLIQRTYDSVSARQYYTDPCADSYRPPKQDPRVTDLGRRVFGGGGIAPDIRVDELRKGAFQQLMENRRAFENYAQKYCLDRLSLPDNWTPRRTDVRAFRDDLEERLIPYDDDEFDEEDDYITRQIKKHVYTACVDYGEGLRVDAELDPAVHEAAALLPDARKLLDRVTEALAQRD